MRRRARTIGLISDTHGLVRPEALAALRGVELILLHGGDIGRRPGQRAHASMREVLAALEAIAPVIAVRGNNDTERGAKKIPVKRRIEHAGIPIVLIHDVKDLDDSGDARIVVSGHSHHPKIEEREGVLYVNPGSAGPRRFSLPITLALLEIQRGDVHAALVTL